MSEDRGYDNFNDFAENYHDICDKAISISGANSSYFHEHKVLELLKFEDKNKAIRILDFGCGDGQSVLYLKKHFPNAIITGIDVSEKSIAIANKRSLKNCSFQFFNGKKIPFGKNEFDIVFTSMVFHHIEHKFHIEILKELVNTLKKGGRFYTFEHNPNNPFTNRVVKDCEYDKHAVLLKSSYNSEIIKKSVLTVMNINYTIFFPRHKLFKIFLNLEKMLTWCPIGAQYYIRAIK